MDKEKFTTAVLVIMAIFLLMGVFGLEKQNASTQIIYVQADPAEAAPERESSKSTAKTSSKTAAKSSSKSSSKATASKSVSVKSTSSKETSSKEVSSKNSSAKESNSKKETVEQKGDQYYIYLYPETSTVYEDFSIPEPDFSEPNISEIPSSEWISSEEESSELPPSSQPELDHDFRPVEQLQQHLSEQYQLNLQVNTERQISDDELLSGEGYFEDAERALFELETLAFCLDRIGQDELTGLTQQGWELKVILTLEIPNQQENVIVDFQQQTLCFWIAAKNNWVSDFYGSVCEGFDFVLNEQGVLQDCHQRFVEQNPEDFEYGKYRPEYLNQFPESTYFISIAGQLSVEQDRSYLYRMFQSGSAKEEYFSQSCPAYRKWLLLLEDYREHFILETDWEEEKADSKRQ